MIQDKGVIDGDWSVIFVDRERRPYFKIQISSGSSKFLKQLSNVIKIELGISVKVKNIHRNTFLIRYTCSEGEKLAKWIYKNSNIFLYRKYEQYLIMQKRRW